MGEKVGIIEYGLGDRDELTELRERYSAMKNVLSEILNCGRWDIEELFDSKNNIEVGEIVKEYVEETGQIPNWNQVYWEAAERFASENDLEIGVDIDLYTNACMDTHLYIREGLDEEIVDKLQDLFGMDAEVADYLKERGEER